MRITTKEHVESCLCEIELLSTNVEKYFVHLTDEDAGTPVEFLSKFEFKDLPELVQTLLATLRGAL